MSKDYKIICQDAIAVLKNNKKSLEGTLTGCETLIMFNDEYERTIDLLENIHLQEPYVLDYFNNTMACYLPLNQPLYSFFLQVFVPSLMLQKVYYRPPNSQTSIHKELFKLFVTVNNRIEMCAVSRRSYQENYVKKSDIVNFTGKYGNIQEIMKELPSNIAVIYNGSALNPIVVGFDADINKAVDDSITARLYNSGQDCMAPACILVHQSISTQFFSLLASKLDYVRCGNNDESAVFVGNQLSQDSIEDFEQFIKKHSKKAKKIVGGKIDIKRRIIYPTAFYFEKIDMTVQNIYYAPYFIVMPFSNNNEVAKYLSTSFAKEYAGYISEYGNSAYGIGKELDPNLIELKNETLFTAEKGNQEFGGFGMGCNFIYKGGKYRNSPILLSREIRELLT